MKKCFLATFVATVLALLSTLIYSAVGDLYLINRNQDGNIVLQVNDGGTPSDVVTINGTTSTVSINGLRQSSKEISASGGYTATTLTAASTMKLLKLKQENLSEII